MCLKVFPYFKSLYQWIKVSNGLPFVVLVSYTLVGATLFRNLELSHDVEARARYRNSTEYAFTEALQRLMAITCNQRSHNENLNETTRVVRSVSDKDAEHAAKETLFWFIDYLNLTQVIDERSAPTPWTWIGSAFYAGQLYTTIGYGFPVVQTNMGKVVSIIYIMLGIPIFLIILKEVGRLLSRALRKIYKRWKTAKNKLPDSAKRRMSEPVKAIYSLTGVGSTASPTKSMKSTTCSDAPLTTDSPPHSPDAMEKGFAASENNDEKEKNKNESGAFPIPLALAILIMWILISAGLFCFWESGWGYLTSVYFYFVSISTVGLGDIVPSKPDMMLVNFVLILVGLALLSMCISLVQEALERALSQLLQEYINDLEKMAAIVTSVDNEYIEESTTPFEVAVSADLLTAPLTAITNERESYVVGFQQRAKEWFAGKLVENILVPRLDSGNQDSDDEENNVQENASIGGCADSIGEASIANTRKMSAKRLLSRRPNFTLNCNMQTLRAVQAMEKVKLKTKVNDSFRGKLFAKFVTNKQFNKFFDDHVVESTGTGATASIAGTIRGNADNNVNFRSPGQIGRCKLVTPESNPSTKNGSVVTVSSTYDMESLFSTSYLDITYGYSTDSVPKLIALDAKQKADEARIERNRERRHSRAALPPLPTKRSIVSPPLAEVDSADVSSIKINVKESSDSPEPLQKIVTTEPSWKRRCSTPMTLLSPCSDPDYSRSQMPMSRCPSCQHVATAALTHAVEPEALQRVRDLCGLLPGDFAALQHCAIRDRRRTLSPSPSHQDDSGYENSVAIDSHLSDSTWLNSTSLLAPNGVEKKKLNGVNSKNSVKVQR